jgi:hypothetical protein
VVHEGQTGTVNLDIAPILRLWGTTLGDSLPRTIVLSVGAEANAFGELDFRGRGGPGAPQLRVTYVKSYPSGVP